MKWFIQKGIEDVEDQLKRIDRPRISNDMKLRVKDSLMSSLDSKTNVSEVPSSVRSLARRVRDLGLIVVPSAVFKMRVKERIYERISEPMRWQFRIFSWDFTKAVSSALVFVLVLTSVFFFAFDTGVTQAQTLTRITFVDGESVVLRGDKEIPAEVGMVLLENDVVRTGSNGFVTIVYHDDSVTRLSVNTELSINRLVALPVSQVELSLQSGNLWTNVPALSGTDSYFGVYFADKFAEVSDKAAFNIDMKDEDAVEVEVFHSVVYVESKPVISGYKAQISENKSPKVARLNDDDKYEEWVKSNMFEDQRYVDSVVNKAMDDNKDDVKLLADISVSDEALNQLSGDERIVGLLDSFDNRLSEYERLLSEGSKDAAAERLVYIHSLVDDLKSSIDVLEDSVAQDKFRERLNNTLNQHQKVLSLVSPNSEAKDLLYDVESDLAPKDADKARIDLKKASQNLTETVDLLDEGDSSEVKKQLKESGDLVRNVGDIEDKNKSESLLNLLENEQKLKDVRKENTVVNTPSSEVEDVLSPQFNLNLQKDNLLK